MQLLDLIRQNRPLFWSIGDSNLDKLSEDSVVEAILNLGDEVSVRQLFDILSTEKVAQIFYKRSHQERSNYYPQIINFFDLYFSRHVPGYPNFKSN